MPKTTATNKPKNFLAHELYKKNLDLLHANRSLKLLQKLYELIIQDFSANEVAQHSLEAIARELDYSAGLIALIDPKTQQLNIAAHTKNALFQKAAKLADKDLLNMTFSPQDSDNLLINAFTGSTRRRTTNDPTNLFSPYLQKHQLSQTPEAVDLHSTLVDTIVFGRQKLGVIALSSQRNLAKLSQFEHTLFNSALSVLGVALNRVMIYQDLTRANKELRRLDKLKDEFVYIATHELKTPVTVMKGYLQMIEGGIYGKPPKKLSDPLKELKAANSQLVTLVNDLLEIARSEVKTMTITTSPVKICEVIDSTLEIIKPLAARKKLHLEHACPDKNLTVLADQDKLKEVANNLISNAIKYSEKGKISISHVIEQDRLLTHVADQGAGISPEDQKKLFSRFFRAQQTAGKAPGTGLGLFIVKNIIEKMGGKIWFQSKLGKGTTFTFSLPLDRPHQKT